MGTRAYCALTTTQVQSFSARLAPPTPPSGKLGPTDGKPHRHPFFQSAKNHLHDCNNIHSGLVAPQEPDCHDHGDPNVCMCLSDSVRARLLDGDGPVNAQALFELSAAPALFRVWFFRRLGLFRPAPPCPRHPSSPLRPTVTGDGRVIYRSVCSVCVYLYACAYIIVTPYCLCLFIISHRCRKKEKVLGKRGRDDGPSTECYTKVAAQVRSPLYGANVSHAQFLLMAWCWVNLLGADPAAKFCDVNINTIYTWYDKFRTVAGDITMKLASDIWNGSEKMGGPGKTVQVR